MGLGLFGAGRKTSLLDSVGERITLYVFQRVPSELALVHADIAENHMQWDRHARRERKY